MCRSYHFQLLLPSGSLKVFPAYLGQFFRHESVILSAVSCVGISASAHIGHDHCHAPLNGIALYGSTAHPNGTVIGKTVQKIDRLHFPGLFAVHANQGLCLFRQQDIDRYRGFQIVRMINVSS